MIKEAGNSFATYGEWFTWRAKREGQRLHSYIRELQSNQIHLRSCAYLALQLAQLDADVAFTIVGGPKAGNSTWFKCGAKAGPLFRVMALGARWLAGTRRRFRPSCTHSHRTHPLRS